ncbi:MAG: hypothetical protein WBP03_05860 [Candidatus Saccharimonadales bacterium]
MQVKQRRTLPAVEQAGFSHHFLLPLTAILVVAAIGMYMLKMGSAAVPGDSTGRMSRRAAAFIDSQGVVAHLDDPTEMYNNKNDVLSALNYLGIHNVRSYSKTPGEVRTWVSQHGINITYNTLVPQDGVGMPLSAHLDVAKSGMDEKVANLLTLPTTGDKYVKTAIGVEAYNEYDNKNDPNWEVAIAAAQKRLWDLKPKLTAANPNVKILGPSTTGFRSDQSTKDLQRQNIGSYMDYGNIHTYPRAQAPETNLENGDGFNGFVVPESTLAHESEDLAYRLRTYSTRVSGTKPIVITETGYHDYANQPRGSGSKYTDPRAVALYMPRLYLENFRIGVLKTYTYELFNERKHSEEAEKHYGFFEVGTRPVAKASATAMHDLNNLLKDDARNAKTFTRTRLDYTIANQPDTVKTVLLQKASGKFYLVVWKAESVFTPGDGPGTGKYHEPAAPTNYRLTFGRNRTVNAYNSGSSKKTSLGANKKAYTISVSGRPTILEIQ